MGSPDIDPRAHMHAGVVCYERGCGVVMSKATRDHFGFQLNDYVYIESEDRDTRICRQIRSFPVKTRTSKGYVYMDKDSLDLLNVDMHACLWVSKSDISFEAP